MHFTRVATYLSWVQRIACNGHCGTMKKKISKNIVSTCPDSGHLRANRTCAQIPSSCALTGPESARRFIAPPWRGISLLVSVFFSWIEVEHGGLIRRRFGALSYHAHVDPFRQNNKSHAAVLRFCIFQGYFYE